MAAFLQRLVDRVLGRRPPPRIFDLGTPHEKGQRDRIAVRWPVSGKAALEWIAGGEERRLVEVELVDRSDDGLGVRSNEAFEVGLPVLIALGEEGRLKAVVRNCRREGDGYRLGLKLVHHERRRHDRMPIEGQAIVSWQSGEGKRRAPVEIRDVGEGGLGLAAKERIPDEASVMIEHEGWQRFATVTHGSFEDDWYVFGVQFVGPPRMLEGPDYRD